MSYPMIKYLWIIVAAIYRNSGASRRSSTTPNISVCVHHKLKGHVCRNKCEEVFVKWRSTSAERKDHTAVTQQRRNDKLKQWTTVRVGRIRIRQTKRSLWENLGQCVEHVVSHSSVQSEGTGWMVVLSPQWQTSVRAEHSPGKAPGRW